jgi:phosphatidate cytidylyltransferase
MAFNLQTFKTRTLSALIFAVIMIFGLIWSHWTFFLLFTVIHFGCWLEYQKLLGLIDTDYAKITPFHKYGVMVAGWCIMLYFTNDAYHIYEFRLHELGWWLGFVFIFILPILELLFNKDIKPKNIGYSFLGLIYISLSCGLMVDLRNAYFNHLTLGGYVDLGYIIPLGLIFSIWANDSFAYLVGSFIGRTPFSKISPKKTWEGTIGGAILCVLLIGYLGSAARFFTLNDWLIIAGIAAVAGTLGDLLESKLKRMAGVKDSGSLMPGHGGYLDRFDSLLVAIPFAWIYVYCFMR